MTAPALPKYIPNIASTGGNYTSGPATGTPRIVEPSAGDQAAGYVPGDDADAQTVNFYLNALGQHIESLIDEPSFSWSAIPTFQSAHLQNATYNPGGNANTINDPPLFRASSDGYIFAQGYVSGSNNYTVFSRKFGQGVGVLASDTASATETTTTLTANTNEVPGTDGRVITVTGLDTTQLAQFLYIGTGTNKLRLRYSTDHGGSFTGASGGFTDIDASLANSELFVAFQLFGAWYVGVKTGPGPYSTQFYMSSSLNLASATWSQPFFASNPLLANDCIIRRAAASSSIMVMVPERDQYVITWDGVTKTQTAFASHDASKTNWRISYNKNIGLFAIVNVQGDVWTSPDGINWAPAYTVATAVYDIKAHGRGFLLTDGDNVSQLYQDKSQAWQKRTVLEAYGSGGNPLHLVATRGRVIAVRAFNDGSNWKLEWYQSGAHPLDRAFT